MTMLNTCCVWTVLFRRIAHSTKENEKFENAENNELFDIGFSVSSYILFGTHAKSIRCAR